MRFQGVFTELHCTSMSAFTDANKIWVDPHRVHCTAITKRLKLYAETSHASGPLHIARKVTSSSQEIGGSTWPQNIDQSAIHPFILET